MRHAAYVFSAWGVTLAAIGLYAAALRLRGRRLLHRARADQREPGESRDDG